MVVIKKPTLILGASLNEMRYSNRAIKKLLEFNIEVLAVGKNKGETHGIKIQNEFPLDVEINTLSIYLNASHQHQYIDSILNLSPNRVIFNPGSENPDLFKFLFSKGIFCENSCTLVLLSTNQY